MRKRIVSIILGCFLTLTLVSCGDSESSEIITLPNTEPQTQTFEVESHSNVLVYKTEELEEYLTFLEDLDESNNEILGVTTCMYTGPYTSGEFYMVTYKKLDEPREVRATGKVSLFRTESEKEYCNFLTNFDENNNEILGATTCMYTGIYSDDEFYMVTFRELK